MELRPLKKGSQVTAGTVLGRIGKVDESAPRVHFQIQPAGRGAPKIDPKPILDGWKLLEATAIYRAAGDNPLTDGATTGQILLMSKTQLIGNVLSNPRIETYACGRDDIRTGQIDQRRARPARLSDRARIPAHDHLAQVRPLHPHLLRQRQPPLLGQRRRHRADQRPAGARQPGSRLDHRSPGPRRDGAPGHQRALADHLADGLRRRQHLRDGRSRRPRPRRLHAGHRSWLGSRASSSRSSSPTSGSA